MDIYDFPSLNNNSDNNNSFLSFSKLEEINKENNKNYEISKIKIAQVPELIVEPTATTTHTTSNDNADKSKKKRKEEYVSDKFTTSDTVFLFRLQNNILKSKLKELQKQLQHQKDNNKNKENDEDDDEDDEFSKEFEELQSFLDNTYRYKVPQKQQQQSKKSNIEEIPFDQLEESEIIEKIDSILYETFKKLEPFSPTAIEKSNGYYFLEKLVKGFEKSDKQKSDQKKLNLTGIRRLRNKKKKNLLNYINLLKSNINDSNDQFNHNYYKNELEKKTKIYRKLADQESEEDPTTPTDINISEKENIENIINEKNEDNSNRLLIPKRCYICKEMFKTIHQFYDGMCFSCGEYNYEKRMNSVKLEEDRVAIVTGSRIKIGYETTLKLLRSGCTVIATSRFPKDTAIRFYQEKDFKEWSNRLHIYALNLCDLKSLELFCTLIKQKFNSINIIINNAAQTIKKPSKFYETILKLESSNNDQLLPIECKSLLNHFNEIKALYLKNDGIIDMDILGLENSSNSNNNNLLLESISKLSLISTCNSIENSDKVLLGNNSEDVIDLNKFDENGQPIDGRNKTSWNQTFNETPLIELIEAHAISSFSPYILLQHLEKEIKNSSIKFGNSFIINVNAMEGRFSRFYKSVTHPHTNMSKASQNMMTRTISPDLAIDNIYMNSVDTGWVTDESPNSKTTFKLDDQQWQPPLDEIDGASRILDPIYSSLQSKNYSFGFFFKDYKPINW